MRGRSESGNGEINPMTYDWCGPTNYARAVGSTSKRSTDVV